MDNTSYHLTLSVLYYSKNKLINQIYSCMKENSLPKSDLIRNCNPKTEYFISNNKVDMFIVENYLIVKLNRYLQLLSSGIKYSSSYEKIRDLNMFKTFEDIYKYQLKTQKEAKIVVLNHAGHGLNFKNSFGSYLRKLNYKLSSYVISLCAGFISSYTNDHKEIVNIEISELNENLLEYSVCNKKTFNKSNTDFLFYVNVFSSDHSAKMPDFTFEGFFAIIKSRPLDFSK